MNSSFGGAAVMHSPKGCLGGEQVYNMERDTVKHDTGGESGEQGSSWSGESVREIGKLDGETSGGEESRTDYDASRLDVENRVDEGVTVRAAKGNQLKPHRWSPGQSGNPLGRSKKDILMIDTLALSFPPDVIAAHIQDVIDRASPKTKIEAIKLLLLYIVGRPGVTITHEKGPGALYLEYLKSIPAGSIVAGSASRVSEDEDSN